MNLSIFKENLARKKSFQNLPGNENKLSMLRLLNKQIYCFGYCKRKREKPTAILDGYIDYINKHRCHWSKFGAVDYQLHKNQTNDSGVYKRCIVLNFWVHFEEQSLIEKQSKKENVFPFSHNSLSLYRYFDHMVGI